MLLADIASTGFSGAESGIVRIGDSVVVFAQGADWLVCDSGSQTDGRVTDHRVDSDETRLDICRGDWARMLRSTTLKLMAWKKVKRLTGGGS